MPNRLVSVDDNFDLPGVVRDKLGIGSSALLVRYLDIWNPITVPNIGAGAVAAFYSQVESTLGPDATKETLGQDGSATFDVNAYTAGTGPFRVVMAGVHGREGIGQALRWFESFAKHSSMRPLRDAFTVCYIPLLNPHGYENGTTLFPSGGDGNRSWAHFWDRYVDGSGTRPKGPAVMSAVECGLLKSKVDAFKPQILIDTHGAAMADKITYTAPSPASGGNHVVAKEAAERTRRMLADDGIGVGVEGGEGTYDLAPMLHNWFGWYAKHTLGLRNATGVLIEPGVDIDAGSHTDPSRLSVRSYATMVTNLLVTWLMQGRPERYGPVTWIAEQNSGSDTVAIASGGRMVNTTEGSVTWQIIIPSAGSNVSYVDVVMPFPGTLDIAASGWIISGGSAVAEIDDTARAMIYVDGAASDNHATYFQIPRTVGQRVGFQASRQVQLLSAPDAATVVRVELKTRVTFAGGTAVSGHKARAIRLKMTAIPTENESRVPRLH